MVQFLKIFTFFILGLFFFITGSVAQQSAYSLNEDKNITPIAVKELKTIDSILRSRMPVRRLMSIDNKKVLAQQILFRDTNFTKHIVNFDFNVVNRCEIFSVTKAIASDLPEDAELIKEIDNIYVVTMFNFGENITTIGLVNVITTKVISVDHFKNIQTDIPDRLMKLAINIALESEIVAKALGFTPETKDAIMAGTKTSLSNSKCERSKHLCVAPTFVKDNKALWVIVDLTDLRVVGLEWTALGENSGNQSNISERSIQNKTIYDCYCLKTNNYQDSLWTFDYNLTNTDGLEISNVSYKGKMVIKSAKLVDWKVSYSPTKGFGYSDAVGCPYYSAAVVVAVKPPIIEKIIKNEKIIGIKLTQEFSSEGWPGPCNYNYAQKYEFYTDGSFRTACASLGRGCGTDGTYRPVYRIHFEGSENRFFQYNAANSWSEWQKEGYNLQSEVSDMSKEGYLYKIENSHQTGYYIEPSNGQFDDGGRGDNAWVYVTKHHENKDEGQKDLPTISSCCNSNHEQGPERFIDSTPEDIKNTSFVVWYVPQLTNDNKSGREYCWAEVQYIHGIKQVKSYPCWGGPKFVPIIKNISK